MNRSKLSDKQIQEIKDHDAARTFTKRELATRYHVSPSMISTILKADLKAEEAARTPDDWKQEVTRLEALLQNPEIGGLRDRIQHKVNIAKAKAAGN